MRDPRPSGTEPAENPPKAEEPKAADPPATPPGGVDYLVKVAPQNPETARKLEQLLAEFEKTKPAERINLIEKFFEIKDPAILPYLAAMLGDSGDEDKDAVRVAVTMGMVQYFPKEAVEMFEQLLVRGNAAQKESAAFGMGRLMHPRQSEILVPFLFSEDEKVRRAAIQGLSTPIELVNNGYQNHANAKQAGKEFDPIPEDLLKRRAQVCEAVMTAILARGLDTHEEPFMLVRRFGNHQHAVALTKHWASKLPAEQRQLGELIERLVRVNRRWAGRPERADIGTLQYTFWMHNLLSNKEKEFDLIYTPDGIEALVGRGLRADRGVEAQLGIDELLLYPQICKPVLVSSSAETTTLEYHAPLSMNVKVGLGTMNISYMVGQTPPLDRVRLTIENRRGVPIQEECFLEDDTLVAQVAFEDYKEIAKDVFAPGRILVDVPGASMGKKPRHMNYELEFHVKDGLWLLREAIAYELADGDKQERAFAEIRDPVVIAAVIGPTAPSETPEAPGGEGKGK